MITTTQHPFEDQYEFSDKKLRSINIFWIGFSIYSFTAALSDLNLVTLKILQIFQLLGLVILITGALLLIRFQIKNFYLKILCSVYCCWVFALILRDPSFLSTKESVLYFLLNPYLGLLPYFAPLILLFPQNVLFFKKTYSYISLFGIFYILFVGLSFRYLISSDHSNVMSRGVVETSFILSFPSGFLLLTYDYHSKKKIIFSSIVILLTLLFAVIRARRGLITMTSSLIFFSFLLYLLTSKNKILMIYLAVLLFLSAALYITHLYKPEENRLVGFISQRGTEDTRTAVELYFYDDMKLNDWIIGRGINGKYYCPDIEEDMDYRSVIETGYLQIILKGGLIELLLLLLIFIPAIIMGLFYSKNMLSKAAAIWIIIALISLYPALVVNFTLNYLLVWICVGICYSKKIRNLPNSYIKTILNN